MENLDDFIKGKLEEMPVEFNEAHWMQAAALINQQDEEKRRRFLKWSFLSQMLVFVLIFTFISFASNDKPLQTIANNDLNLNQNTEKENLGQNTGQEGVKSIESPTKFLQTLPSTSDLSNENSELIENQVDILDQNNPTNPSTPQTQTDNIQDANGENPIKTINTVIEQGKNEIKTSPIVVLPNQQESTNTDEVSNESDVVLGINTTVNQKLDVNQPDDSRDETSNSAYEEPVLHPEQDVVTTDLIANSREFENAISLLQNDFKYLENERSLDTKTATQIYKEKKPYESIISLNIASTLFPYSQVGAQTVIGYTAGLHYTKSLNRRWNIDAGLHYSVRKGSYANSSTTSQDEYAFKRIRTYHTLQATQMNTIDLPLSVLFNHKRHQFQFGLSYTQLLGLRGDMSKTLDLENPSEFTAVGKGWITDDNFKTKRVDLLAGYYFTIKPGLKMGATMHYVLGGFQNKNTPVELHLESKPIFVNIGIRYDLLTR